MSITITSKIINKMVVFNKNFSTFTKLQILLIILNQNINNSNNKNNNNKLKMNIITNSDEDHNDNNNDKNIKENEIKKVYFALIEQERHFAILGISNKSQRSS